MEVNMILPFSYIEQTEKELGPEKLAEAYELFAKVEKSSNYVQPAEDDLPSLEELIPMIQESMKFFESLLN